jgi:hypothetical protein
MPIGFAASLLVFSDAEVPSSHSTLSTLLFIIAIVTGCIAGGYYCATIAKRKELIHAVAAGTILTLLYAWVNDFRFNITSGDSGIIYFSFLPLMLLGAAIGKRSNRTP